MRPWVLFFILFVATAYDAIRYDGEHSKYVWFRAVEAARDLQDMVMRHDRHQDGNFRPDRPPRNSDPYPPPSDAPAR